MLETMTQAQNARNHDIDMMVQTLRSYRLTNSDVANHSVRAEESCCFGNQGSEIHLEGGWIGVIANLMIFLNLSKYEWCNDLSKHD